MKKILIAGTIAGVALLIAACDNATTGEVTSREHVPFHQDLYFVCGSYASNGTCTVQVPMFQDVPECWRVNFHNAKDDENGSACVSESEYQFYDKIGMQYPRPR